MDAKEFHTPKVFYEGGVKSGPAEPRPGLVGPRVLAEWDGHRVVLTSYGSVALEYEASKDAMGATSWAPAKTDAAGRLLMEQAFLHLAEKGVL